jgi:hypothetical protein
MCKPSLYLFPCRALELKYFFFISILILSNQNTLQADDALDEIELRKNRAIEQCKNNPIDPKCEKLLDAKYRKLKDSEKEYKVDKEERYFEQKIKKQSLSELRAFCRNTPDSERCNLLKSK